MLLYDTSHSKTSNIDFLMIECKEIHNPINDIYDDKSHRNTLVDITYNWSSIPHIHHVLVHPDR